MEKKIHKLVRFLEEHEDDDNVGDFWVKILMAHADTLRGQVERIEADWDNLRDKILQQDFARIKEFVESSMAALEAALYRADLFVCRRMAQQATKSEDANSSTNSTDASLLGTTSGKLDRLDNTLRPTDRLSRTMTLEESSKWLKNFDSYLNWNQFIY